MEYSSHEIRRNHIFGSQARVIECCLVGVERRPGWIENNYCLRYRVGNPAKFAFIVPQFLFVCLSSSMSVLIPYHLIIFARLVA